MRPTFSRRGFDLYDEHTVVVGVVGGSAYYNDPSDVARYVAMLAALERLAIFGDEARAELRRVADEYRTPDG
ncbi:MAG: Scr1 family TA system antitoxin-like transcriptional regulator [Pseudonocardiaceae bacterium]